VLDTTFLDASEAAAARWDVSALAFGFEHGDGTSVLHGAGCDADTRFRIASVTKPMTASLAFHLLDLDRATGVWPEDVRVRHLLSHTSGFDGECGDLARFGDGDDALAAAVRELPTVKRFAGVDRVWSYANSGYWLAGLLAAEAAAMTFEEALRVHVTEPARMDATSFDAPELNGTGPGATDAAYPRARRPSGGLVSNVPDLLRFARWQLESPWTAALRVPLGKPPGGVYGLGFFGERVGGVDVWGHDGSYGGFQSSLLLIPARDAAFVGLTNSGRGRQALREIQDVWFEALLGEGRRSAPTIDLSPAVLALFTGRYANPELDATVTVGGSGLCVELLQTATGEPLSLTGRAIGADCFEVVGGDYERDRFDFPLPGFARLGSRLVQRVE